MKVVTETQSVLLPYLRSQDMLFCAVTGQPHFPNPQLHLKLLRDVLNPAETPTFYEMSLHPDGTRGMVFVDGHVKLFCRRNGRFCSSAISCLCPLKGNPFFNARRSDDKLAVEISFGKPTLRWVPSCAEIAFVATFSLSTQLRERHGRRLSRMRLCGSGRGWL